MNKFVFCTLNLAVLFFAACGDDSSSATRPSDESSSSVALSSSSTLSVTGNHLDSRDGQSYKTVTIGSQTWMGENLNFEMENSYCHENKTDHCDLYGRYYTWDAAMNACPAGWHLPTWDEFDILISAVGGVEIAGKKLKSASGWFNDGNGTDAYGFSILPAGEKSGGVSRQAHFWTATEFSSTYASYVYLSSDNNNVAVYNNDKEVVKYVRCVKD